jgi:NADPH-dependent glutamate synthase beta subunit-like oxidoreductase/NAD(P)H-flavin reductase
MKERIIESPNIATYLEHPKQQGLRMPLQQDKLTINLPGFTYEDLFIPEKLAELTQIFYDKVQASDGALWNEFVAYKESGGKGLKDAQISAILVNMAPHLSWFVETMFGVSGECRRLRTEVLRDQIIFRLKKEFFTRRALKKYNREQALSFDLVQMRRSIEVLSSAFTDLPTGDRELSTAAIVAELLELDKTTKDEFPDWARDYLVQLSDRMQQHPSLKPLLPSSANPDALRLFLASMIEAFEKWIVSEYFSKSRETKDWVTFKLPMPLDFDHLVDTEAVESPATGTMIGSSVHYRHRDGFDLTDSRFTDREIENEVDYCIFCHERSKDSCSKGFHEKTGYRKNPLGATLKGCPLDQKISESQLLKSRGDVIGALAIIAIDNPMCPGTGHRICNDCMKACIYQKQEPVNIPQIETSILTDVLNLPWGFEIYSLLTRWNPLNIHSPHALPYNGKKILVVGMGPAGYTLAHYFLNEGYAVVGIDGLKIEPLPKELVGDVDTPFQPLRDYSSISRNLSERILLGFGGVSEYGITVRWDKNFLTVIYLNILRRRHFRLYDGVRFGGTLSVDDAWSLGIDHVCLASGAGKPTFVTMKNNLIRGIRKASDFLMALQLTGAGKRESLANLQVRLPALVIGGGLTAIDTATELMAYYPVQVEKIKSRYDALIKEYGVEKIQSLFDGEQRGILEMFLRHAEEIQRERSRAAAQNEKPDFIRLIRSWGGVQIFYRKSLTDSPAYRLNHEEVIKSLEEGIAFVESMNPLEAVPDEFGALKEMVFDRQELTDGKRRSSGKTLRVQARSLFVAAGTVPNVMYEREHPGTFELDEWNQFFQSYGVSGGGELQRIQSSENEYGFFTSYERNGKFVTFYGDNHPEYAGNVVKAMASAKHGYRKVLDLFKVTLPDPAGESVGPRPNDWKQFVGRLDKELRATVERVQRLTPTIIEIVVRAPRAARQFEPGQFYRLQNYETDSLKIDGTLLMMEGIALTGAWVDKDQGLVSLIALEVGASSKLCSVLKPGQRVVLMGPTGCPTEIEANSTVLLLGGGLGNAVLFSIAKAYKRLNSKVIYFAGYKKKEDFYKREEIESSTDVVVYSVDAGDLIETRRPQDKTYRGNIIQAMIAYGTGELGNIPLPLNAAGRVIAIGSDRMMNAVTQARHTVLKPFLDEHHVGIASINSSMQCMMKAICAQCLQRHVDPVTGKEEFVFSCVNQDQLMDEVDFSNLSARLQANSVMEKITGQWLEHIFQKHKIERV